MRAAAAILTLALAAAFPAANRAGGAEAVKLVCGFEPKEMAAYGKVGKVLPGNGQTPAGHRAQPIGGDANDYQLYRAASSRDWAGHVFSRAGATEGKFALVLKFNDKGRAGSGGAEFTGKGGNWSGYGRLRLDVESPGAPAALELGVIDEAGRFATRYFQAPKGQPAFVDFRLDESVKAAGIDPARIHGFLLRIGSVAGATDVRVDNLRLVRDASAEAGGPGRKAAAEQPGPARSEEQQRLLTELKACPHRIVFQSLPFKSAAGGRPDWDIHIMDADGGNRANLTRTPDVHEVVPRVSPDGTKIAFGAYTTGKPQRSSVWVMDVDGSNRKLVAENAQHPAWTTDGRCVTYCKNLKPDKASIFKLKGACSYELATGKVTPVTDVLGGMNLCWMADGRHLYIWNKYGGLDGNGESGIWDTKENKKSGYKLGGCRADFCSRSERYVYTPTDTQIRWGSYVADPDGSLRRPKGGERPGEQHIFAAGDHNLGYCYFPDWSPEGKLIAFCAGFGAYTTLGGGDWDIYVCRELPPGGKPRKGVEPVNVQITFDVKTANREPDWVPARTGK
jgi:hypothetical protein